MRRRPNAAPVVPSALAFVLRVTLVHALTYVVAGALAAGVFDYRSALIQPLVRDYMLPFGSAPVFWGPLAQLGRGLVIGLALLPLRGFLAGTRRGWLYLWLLLVGIGIVGTPAAAPSSFEGLVYTRLPGWYHLFGLPEMLAQTLVFSVLVHLSLRRPSGGPEARGVGAAARALAGASFAFVGYAVFSVAFALLAGADVGAEVNTSLRTLGLFAPPFALNVSIVWASSLSTRARGLRRTAAFSLVLVSNAAAIALYQALVLGGANLVYALAAPVLPAAIIATAALGPRAGPEVPGGIRENVR